MSVTPRLIEVRKNVLKQNDILARALRERFRGAGVYVISLVSAPDTGKTALLERTLTLLQPPSRAAALVGDLATDNDAMRLARSMAPVRQITTGTVCHLEAAMVKKLWKVGISKSSTFPLSKMLATLSALRPTIWEKIFD